MVECASFHRKRARADTILGGKGFVWKGRLSFGEGQCKVATVVGEHKYEYKIIPIVAL